MKKLIYGGLFLVLVGVGFVRCEKEAGSKAQNGRLTSEQIEEIGNLHNHYLELAFKDFDYSTKNFTNELTSNFQKIIENENIEINLADVEVDTEKNINLLSKNLSSEAMEIINNAMSRSIDIENVESFADYIQLLESKAKKNLAEKDLDATLVTLCVLRKSASFWTPIEKGGSGIGENILSKIKESNKDIVTLKASPKSVLAADGAAAGGGMIGAAVVAAAATGPVGWGFLAGVGITSGIASGWYALTH